MRFVLLKLIRAYQVTLSPDHGPLRHFHPYGYCRFAPTCSSYGYGCIERFGSVRGGWMAVRRILRCHPWSPGGADPIPET